MKITTAMGHAFGAALRKGEPLVVDPDGLVILDQDAGVVSVVCGDQAAAELTDYSAWLVDKLRPSPTCELLLTGDVVSCKQFAYRKPSVVMAFEHDGERMMLRGSVVARQFSHRPPSSLPAKPELNDEWIEKLQTARCP